MNAIMYLKKEHARFKATFKRIAKIKSETAKQKAFAKLGTDLLHHEKTEETVWYPYLKKNTNLTPVIKKLITEEKAGGKGIKKLKKVKDETKFDKEFRSLSKAIITHAGHEEKRLFPRAAAQVEKSELVMLGAKMKKFKAKLDK